MEIGIDIDGILTNSETWQLDVGSKFSPKYNKNVVVPDGYDSNVVFNTTKKIDSEFWSSYLYDYTQNGPAKKFSSEVIGKLRNKGYEIYIIKLRYLTAKNDDLGNEMVKIVKEWLKSNKISYDELIFSPKYKLEICEKNSIGIMIENKVENINNISKINTSYMF